MSAAKHTPAADFLHRCRRFLWSITGVASPYRCHGCGADLTPEEREHYGTNCERCEGVDYGRLDAALRESVAERAHSVAAGGVAWEQAARDVLENPRAVEEIKSDIADMQKRLADRVQASSDLDYFRACERQNVALLEAIGYPHEKDTLTSPEEYAVELKRKADAFDAPSALDSARLAVLRARVAEAEQRLTGQGTEDGAVKRWLREIAALVQWDEQGATGPTRKSMSWESVARLACDYARAGLSTSRVVQAPSTANTVHATDAARFQQAAATDLQHLFADARTTEAPSKCEFPVCAVHNICERNCERNAGAPAVAEPDWKALGLRYEAALRHLAETAFATKDWQYARDALGAADAKEPRNG